MYILLVEDERRLSQLVRRVLEEGGHTVDAAYDGEEGLAMATEGSHDVIVLDYDEFSILGLDSRGASRAGGMASMQFLNDAVAGIS